MRREGEGRRGARTTREDTRKEEGVRRASRNPVYVSRYRDGGREKNKMENNVKKGGEEGTLQEQVGSTTRECIRLHYESEIA